MCPGGKSTCEAGWGLLRPCEWVPRAEGGQLEIMELECEELALDRVCLLCGSWFPCSSFRDLALISKAPSEVLENDRKEGSRAHFVVRTAHRFAAPLDAHWALELSKDAHGLSQRVAASHGRPLSTGSKASATREPNILFHFIVTNLNLNQHMRAVATVLDGAAFDNFFHEDNEV